MTEYNRAMRLNKRTVKFHLHKNTITFYIDDFSRTYKYNNFDDDKHLIHEILLQTFMSDYESRRNKEQICSRALKLSEGGDMNDQGVNLLSNSTEYKSDCKPLFDNDKDSKLYNTLKVTNNSETEEYDEEIKRQMIKECIKREDLLFQHQETTEVSNSNGAINDISNKYLVSNDVVSKAKNKPVDLTSIFNTKYNIKSIFDVPNDKN